MDIRKYVAMPGHDGWSVFQVVGGFRTLVFSGLSENEAKDIAARLQDAYDAGMRDVYVYHVVMYKEGDRVEGVGLYPHVEEASQAAALWVHAQPGTDRRAMMYTGFVGMVPSAVGIG